MASVVSICNLALSNIGKENISSLSEATAEARACSQFYEITRDMLLQGYPWRFAETTVSLAEIDNLKPGAWGYAYQRPSDCLKVRWVRPEYSVDAPAMTRQDELSLPYEIEGDVIFCDLSPAFLRFTSRLTDPTKFHPLFVDDLSWHLAVRLAMPLTRDAKVRADCWQVANQMTGQAQMMDANEQRETADHVSEYLTGRG